MSHNSTDNKGDVPLGFGMALAQNSAALQAFSALDKSAREEVIRRSAGAQSKTQMQEFVNGLVRNSK